MQQCVKNKQGEVSNSLKKMSFVNVFKGRKCIQHVYYVLWMYIMHFGGKQFIC